MNHQLLWAFFLVGAASIFGENLTAKPHPSRTTRQGICGTITEKRGNQMPDPDQPRSTAGGRPAVREVLIFSVLKLNQVTSNEAGFIADTNGAKPIKTTKSDENGKFCVYGLPAGTYSVMVREQQGLYANLSDVDGRINPVTVKRKQISTATVQISHGATF
jgi:hypothetical protein